MPPTRFAWRQAVRPDSALWTQGYLPWRHNDPGIDMPCRYRHLRIFLVADSAGVRCSAAHRYRMYALP